MSRLINSVGESGQIKGSWVGKVSLPKGRDHHEAYCAELEWLLLMGDSAMGERGTLGGVVAVLEHGGQFSGVPSSDLYSDAQVGFGLNAKPGLVERHRWLIGAWFLLPSERHFRLLKCYRAPTAEFRSDEGFGAREVCPRAEDIERNRNIETSLPTAFHHRKGTEARLGRYAALAFHLTDDPGALLVACQDPSRGKASRVINRALKVARAAAIDDHVAWSAAMAAAPKPRARAERAAYLPVYHPHGASQ